MLDVIIGSEGSMVHKSRVAKDSSLVDLPSLKLTWPLKIGHPKKNLVFQRSIFRCHVSFREGMLN